MANDRWGEAADWWLRLREPNVPPETIAAWMRWCDAREDNLQAFEGVQEFWRKAGAAPLQPVNHVELLQGEGRRKWPWAVAASAIIATVTALYLLTRASLPEGAELAGQGNQISTPTGKMQDVALPDGSHIKLGADSQLSTAFTADRRIVRLGRGEAFFNVAKSMRPFVVITPSATVTALGTAFNVRADDKLLKVTVAEGLVQVGTGAERDDKHITVRLKAGEQVVVNLSAAGVAIPGKIIKVDPDVAASWTTGTLKFMDEPLSSVVATVNRYSSRTIELRPETSQGLRFTGTVVASRIDEWLSALPNAFPVDVVSDGPQRVRIEVQER
jgi:transmembrane sensor